MKKFLFLGVLLFLFSSQVLAAPKPKYPKFRIGQGQRSAEVNFDMMTYGISTGTCEQGFSAIASIIKESAEGADPVSYDLIAYGIASGTAQEGFDILAAAITGVDITGLTPGDWEALPPDSIVDALNRMSALLKTLNTNTAIP